MGWMDATNEEQAKKGSFFVCPECGGVLTPEQRISMNQQAKLVHRGQTILPGGEVIGDAPETHILGFRWNAFNNLFWSPGYIGMREWLSSYGEEFDEENSEKTMRQKVWAIPYVPPKMEENPINVQAILDRTGDFEQGIVPDDATHLSVGVDLGKWLCWYVVVAFRATRQYRVVDYGSFSVPSDNMDVDEALPIALHRFREQINEGYPVEDSQAMHTPDCVMLDSGWLTDTVYRFIRNLGPQRQWWAAKGHSTNKRWKYEGRYTAPEQRNKKIAYVGEEYDIRRVTEEKVHLVHVNADYWKSRVHRALSVSADEAGALTLWRAEKRMRHIEFAKSMCSETESREWKPGKGYVSNWEVLQKDKNHLLDAGYLALLGLHMAGARTHEVQRTPDKRQQKQDTTLQTPDGRAFLATER